MEEIHKVFQKAVEIFFQFMSNCINVVAKVLTLYVYC